MEQNQNPFKIIDQPIPFGERLTTATQQFFQLLALVPICLITAPITFFRVLFTTSRKVMVIDTPHHQGLTNNIQPPAEPWKQKHDELFGNDEE